MPEVGRWVSFNFGVEYFSNWVDQLKMLNEKFKKSVLNWSSVMLSDGSLARQQCYR